MPSEFIVLLDGDAFGHVFCVDTVRTLPFQSLGELAQHMQANFVGAYVPRREWDPYSIERGKLLSLRMTVISIDERGLHGFAYNHPEHDFFTDSSVFCRIIDQRIKTEIVRRENSVRAKTARLKRRAGAEQKKELESMV